MVKSKNYIGFWDPIPVHIIMSIYHFYRVTSPLVIAHPKSQVDRWWSLWGEVEVCRNSFLTLSCEIIFCIDLLYCIRGLPETFFILDHIKHTINLPCESGKFIFKIFFTSRGYVKLKNKEYDKNGQKYQIICKCQYFKEEHLKKCIYVKY